MPLKLVLGPANSAKAGEVLGAFNALAPRGAVLVVPTAADVAHYQRELAGQGTVLGSVLTFSGLAAEVARRAGYAGRRLSEGQRDEVLRGVVAATGFDVLSLSARAVGFRRAAGELIAELQRSLISPSRLASALGAWAAGDARRAAYAGDLTRLYEHYAAELARLGRVDHELFAWRALDALRGNPHRWGRDQVFFYGFDDLTALERDAIETLARVAGVEVTVSLSFEPGRAALQARAETAAELRALATEVIELPPRDDYYLSQARGALHHLERNLFVAGAARLDPGPAIALFEAGGERAEAELVAAEVLAALRDRVAPEEIAVVYRSVSAVAPLVRRVFAQYGIPVAVAYELPFSHTPLGRALRGAARCAWLGDGDARAADLLAYLRGSGVLAEPDVADRLEAELRREGLSGVAAARQRLGPGLEDLDALVAGADPGSALIALARRLLAAPHRQRAPRLTADETVDARALAALVRALDELTELGRRPGAEALLALLDELSVAAEPPARGGEVRLAEPLQIRAQRYRVVCICGLQEGEFPRPATPEPFLSDERRHELALASGLRLAAHEDVLDRERYLFYATVSRATQRLILSYRSSDEEGNLALASPFVSDVAEVLCADWPQRRVRRLLADVVWTPETAPTPREHARAEAAQRAPAASDPTPAPRRLSPLALGRLRHTEILSAGALEAYADCPVRWLIERELRPEPLAPEFESIVRGNLMHAVLERLLDELDGPLTLATLDRAQRIMSALVQELADGPGAKLGAGQPEVVRAGLLRAIEADLRRYLVHDAAGDAGWRPLGTELRFGFAAAEENGDKTQARRPSLPALALGSEPDRVFIRGMIDRIDVDGRGQAIVRDYKSGGSRPDHPAARWSADRRLQIALYLVAVRELTELDPVAGFYQPLRGDDLRGRGMFVEGLDTGGGVNPRDARPPEAFAAELDEAADRALAVAARLRSGELTPCPQTCSRDGCAYPELCRSQ